MNKNNYVVAVMFDIIKSFDIVIPVSKLNADGIRILLIGASFLSLRIRN